MTGWMLAFTSLPIMQQVRGFTFDLSASHFHAAGIWTFDKKHLRRSQPHCFRLEMLFSVWRGDWERLSQPILHTQDFGLYPGGGDFTQYFWICDWTCHLWWPLLIVCAWITAIIVEIIIITTTWKWMGKIFYFKCYFFARIKLNVIFLERRVPTTGDPWLKHPRCVWGLVWMEM